MGLRSCAQAFVLRPLDVTQMDIIVTVVGWMIQLFIMMIRLMFQLFMLVFRLAGLLLQAISRRRTTRPPRARQTRD